jgi:hypothetical protein
MFDEKAESKYAVRHHFNATFHLLKFISLFFFHPWLGIDTAIYKFFHCSLIEFQRCLDTNGVA